MIRRFQFSLSTLFWAMFVAAVFCGGWQIARFWLKADRVEAAFIAVTFSVYIVVAAVVFVIHVTAPLDD